MFGYIAINKPEMKIKDYDRYRKYYCGVCQSLRNNFGSMGQLSLSYDACFAAILLSGLYEPKTAAGSVRCMVHPLSKKEYISNEILDYVASMNMILSYYKCLDDWTDEKNAIRYGYSLAERKKVREAAGKYPEKVKRIKKQLAALTQMEKNGETNIDMLSACSGHIIAEVLAIKKDEWEKELRRVGFFLGKFIYILDAYDDLDEDVKKKSFNPFANYGEGLDEWVKELLMLAVSEAAKSFERLPIIKETDILRNIIYSGVWTRYFVISERRNRKTTDQAGL